MRVRHASSSWRRERQEVGRTTRRRRARPLNGPPAKMQRGVERERAEQPVDVVGDAERGAARVRVERRDQAVGRGREHRVLVLGQEAQHAADATTGLGGRASLRRTR